MGCREAARELGRPFKPVVAIDVDPEAMATYVQNFSPAFSFTEDIRKIIDGVSGSKPTESEKELVKKIAHLDILLAGPPCQGHSDLNNYTRRNDERNALYERVGRLAELVQPTMVVIENVPNVVHSSDNVVEFTAATLRRNGYAVESGVVDLASIGVAQRRKRHVLVAAKGKEIKITEVVRKHRIARVRSVSWAIKDLEDSESAGIIDKPSKHSRENQRRIDYLFKKGLYDLPNRLRPLCHQNNDHTYKSMYGRLKYTEPSQTITSGFVSPGQGRFIHPNRRRTLTPHEAARIQFFPDFFDFSKSRNRTALATMIGNAVPMKLSYLICLEFLSQ